MSWAHRHSKSKLGDRLVLFVLAEHAHDDGHYAFPSVRTIAEHANLSERQVQRCLRSLGELGEIAVSGRTRSGTHIYAITGYIEHEGGDILSPPQTAGGDSHVTGGVTPTSPEPSVEPSEDQDQVLRTTARARELVTVDKQIVTDDEDRMARAVLAEWNSQTGSSYTAKSWLKIIVMRIREHPEMSIIDHSELIRRQLAAPWWKTRSPTPRLIYGNDRVFERSMNEGTGPRKYHRRYGRGMTPEEMLDVGAGR